MRTISKSLSALTTDEIHNVPRSSGSQSVSSPLMSNTQTRQIESQSNNDYKQILSFERGVIGFQIRKAIELYDNQVKFIINIVKFIIKRKIIQPRFLFSGTHF